MLPSFHVRAPQSFDNFCSSAQATQLITFLLSSPIVMHSHSCQPSRFKRPSSTHDFNILHDLEGCKLLDRSIRGNVAGKGLWASIWHSNAYNPLAKPIKDFQASIKTITEELTTVIGGLLTLNQTTIQGLEKIVMRAARTRFEFGQQPLKGNCADAR
jgi:hypothetical protein